MIYHLLIPKYTENILWLIDSCIIGSILYSLHPPEKRYIGGLITSIHYLEYGFASGNQVNMRSLDRGLVQFDWYPYKKRKFGHRSAPRRMSFEDEDRDWSDAGISQETPKIPENRQELGEQRSWPITMLRRNPPCQYLYHGRLASITVRQCIPSSLWYFGTAALGKHKKRYPK